jgi:hypothetical protein
LSCNVCTWTDDDDAPTPAPPTVEANGDDISVIDDDDAVAGILPMGVVIPPIPPSPTAPIVVGFAVMVSTEQTDTMVQRCEQPKKKQQKKRSLDLYSHCT